MDASPPRIGRRSDWPASPAAEVRELQPRPERRDEISAGPIQLNLATYDVSIDCEPIALTRAEFDLLAYLIRHRDRVRAPLEIGQDVFGTNASTAAQIVRVHVCHLRRALGRFADMLSTVRGRGYRLVVPDHRQT